MKRKQRNKKSDITIDLTSLLDVIFIFLLVLMVGQKAANTTAQSQLMDEQTAISEMQEAKRLYEEAAETARYVKSIAVTVPYTPNEIHKREIRILIYGETEWETIPLIGSDTQKAAQEFKDKVQAYIKQDPDTPVILSLNDDDEKILYRDEKMVTDIFYELMKEYDNVTLKGHLSEEKQ